VQAPHSVHEPFLRRLRKAGHDPNVLRNRARTWLWTGACSLVVLALLPILAPQWSVLTERVCTLLSLIFLMAAIGLWFGMRGRAFVVATVFVLSLYLLTSWTRLAFPLQDFFVVAVLVSFAVFALAGFNLVFIVEEMVYDAHVRIHVRGRGWATIPTFAVVGFAIGLPIWRDYGGPSLPALWTASIFCAVLLLAWWFLAWANGLQGTLVLRELHVFVIGALGATALADGVRALNSLDTATIAASLVPSLLAYLVLIGTWVYTSYTTLQRTHFLLRGDNWRPWVAILLGASFAILAHAQVLVETNGTSAVADLVDLRIAYVVAGVWIGIAFYAARGLNRVFRFVLETRGLDDRSARIAKGAEKVAGGLMGGERLVGGAAAAVFRGLDTVVPGGHRPSRSEGARSEGRDGPGDGDLRR
jgi:hypothetical protein